MSQPWIEKYRGCTLYCAPQQTPDGRFVARLLIVRDTSNGAAKRKLNPGTQLHASAQAAAGHALAVGQDWLDRHPSPEETGAAGARRQADLDRPARHSRTECGSSNRARSAGPSGSAVPARRHTWCESPVLRP